MLADVLFPINTRAFSYLVPSELQQTIKVGSLVLAPFKRTEKTGIVVALDSDILPPHPPLTNGACLSGRQGQRGDEKELKKPVSLKYVKSLLDDEPLVSTKQLKLITWVAQYYMSTTGLALKNAIPSSLFSSRKAGKQRVTYGEDIKAYKKLNLTAEQRKALEQINEGDKGTFLLHGVTGSGKTEVYIRAIQSLPEEKQAIVLVPEIALTAQIIDRFRSAFGKRVVFFHSGLSAGERLTQWQTMRKGEAKVVIGVRSAVFAPFQNLGLIVIDEEQEASYKQFEGLRYSARDVALARAKIEGIKIILGSATPSMEAYHSAVNGKIRYLELTHRLENKPLPHVEIIDMTKEEQETFSFSKKLIDAVRKNHDKGHQSLLMLNRRGYSPFPICSDCGHTYKCPACSITLTYHKKTSTLNCHYCGSYLLPDDVCPECKGSRIKFLGTGTQKIEEELHDLLPELSYERMDRDTTRKKLSHYRMIKRMEERKIDILLGTQMIAKGHDFPDVTVSAVVSADVALNLPDFRSSERAFQLFTQLAGRSGRGGVAGKAYIQTYEPDQYIFDYVKKHYYKGFYESEIEMRRELSYPPFSRLIRIILSFRKKSDGEKITKTIAVRVNRINLKGIEVLGPSPAPIEKVRYLWRWHMILKGKNAKSLRQAASLVLERISEIKEVKIDIDVDPLNML
jgi:primosomal protein N' (replication factor Y)